MEVKNLNEYKYLCLEKEHLINDIEHQKELLKKLESRFERCNNEIKEIDDFLNSIDDAIIKNIVIMKFIDGRTWIDISLELGSSSESYSRNLLNRYLDKYHERQQWII